MKRDVAIVGAGYVGLPLARVFADAGKRVLLVDVDADRPAKADASLVRSMPVGAHGSGALAVTCVVAGASSSGDEDLDPV